MGSFTRAIRALSRSLLLLLPLLLAAGCASVEPRPPAQVPPPGTISVYTIADRLSLDVVASEEDHVVLRDPLNSVLFFGGQRGRAYANGMPIAVGDPVVLVDGTYYVPEALVEQVRAVLRHAPDPVRPPPERPRVSPRPRPGSRGLLVVVDPGHGGRDPGARAVTGHSEKWINLSVAKKLAAELNKRGYDVKLTRDRDMFVGLNSRADISNQADADLFVSIHSDACGTPSVRGTTVYIARRASARAGVVATALARALEAAPMPTRGVRKADFRVLVHTRCPAVLVECGYLTNRQDTDLLLRRDMQNKLVQTLADGIDNATDGW